MQTYELTLKSDVFKTFRCIKAANSLDIDVEKKSIHHLKINADIESDYKIGMIVGSSGSGKTTLAKHIFGDACFDLKIDDNLSILDLLPKELSYEECANLLAGIGLTSVPCWIRPLKTLSNGQRARAEAVLLMIKNEKISIIDEWTSVVDRTVAKSMSVCINKFSKKNNKRIILLSCHYDIIDWVDPDWIIDCNKQEFIDRRSLSQSERKRTERLQFDIKEIGRESWKYFNKYHYLSEKLPGGTIYLFGLFHGQNQIGFQCFANYVMGIRNMYHSNRTVIHPDYVGLGLGVKLINETSKYMVDKYDYKIMAKFSSIPIKKALEKSELWKLKSTNRDLFKFKRPDGRVVETFRTQVKSYSFEFIYKKNLDLPPK